MEGGGNSPSINPPSHAIEATMYHTITSKIFKLSGHVTRVIHSERGASMVEYSLLVALIAMIAFVALQLVGTEVSGAYSDVADGFSNPN